MGLSVCQSEMRSKSRCESRGRSLTIKALATARFRDDLARQSTLVGSTGGGTATSDLFPANLSTRSDLLFHTNNVDKIVPLGTLARAAAEGRRDGR